MGLIADDRDTLIGTGGGGAVPGQLARAGWVRLDAVQRLETSCVVLETFPIEQHSGFPVHDLVGHELLRGCVLTLDFLTMRLHLSDTSS